MKRNVGRLLCVGCGLLLLWSCTSNAQEDTTAVLQPETESSTSQPAEKQTEETAASNRLEEGDIVKEVPALTVHCGAQSITPMGGSSYWHYTIGDEGVGMNALGVHPLDAQAYMSVLEMGEDVATLQFEYQPDSWSAVFWRDAPWGDFDAESVPADKTENGTGIVLERGCIYEISAQWTALESNGGNTTYSFYTDSQ